jgi:hypothetical protein
LGFFGAEGTIVATGGVALEKQYKNDPVTFILRVDQNEVTVADTVRLDLEVQLPEGADIQWPAVGKTLGLFSVVGETLSPPRLGKVQTLVLQKTYFLEPFLPGNYEIPPLHILVFGTHGVTSEPLGVKVKSVLPAGQVELKDIAPPLEISSPAVYWIGGAVCLGVLAGFIFWRRRRLSHQRSRALLPHEIAYGELDVLLAKGLVEAGHSKLFYIELSDILRRYIENRFGLRAPERTTEEFLFEIRSTSILNSQQQDLLQNFLRHCDQVKFSQHQPTSSEIEKSLDHCRGFIAGTEMPRGL